ncbi:helix-turn-helix domain-containing protein [Microlunatus capsulatus]|uniref:helix-turn-helix domain-containing protein n=1 Tax=Microlunatus capsulatus TaxID=99117 RepID=UPI0035F0BE18
MAQALARGSRITGTQRTELAAELGRRYAAGESLRAIAEDTGRSFGFVHGLVKESGVDLRGRGGATRAPAARRAAAARAGRAAPAGADGAAPAAGKPRRTRTPAVAPLDRTGPTVEAVRADDAPAGAGMGTAKAGKVGKAAKPGKAGKAGKKEDGAGSGKKATAKAQEKLAKAAEKAEKLAKAAKKTGAGKKSGTKKSGTKGAR